MEAREDPRGALVRSYVVTRGRTEPLRDVAVEAILLTTPRGQQEARFSGRDKQVIASMCDGRALSLAEVAAYMHLALGVARVLVADMVTDGLLALHEPMQAEDDDRMEVLERVLSGLRKL